jgi:hypothetical protein
LDKKKRSQFAIYPTLIVLYNKLKAGYFVLPTNEKKKQKNLSVTAQEKKSLGLNVRPRVTESQGKVLNFGTHRRLSEVVVRT